MVDSLEPGPIILETGVMILAINRTRKIIINVMIKIGKETIKPLMMVFKM